MKTNNKIEFLFVKDVQRIMGYRSYTTARQKVQDIKDLYGIKNRRITVEEFCRYFDLPEDKIRKML